MNKEMQIFSFFPPINLVEAGRWLLGVIFSECTNSIFKITNENNSFSIIIPGRWRILNYLEDGIIDKLKDLIKLRSQNDIELHVEKIRKRGNKIKIKDREYKLSVFGTSKNEIFEELKSAIYHDLEDLVYRMELSYYEIRDVLDIKNFPSEKISYTLPPGIHEICDVDGTLEYILPDFAKKSITIDDIRLGSNLNFKY